MIRNLCYSISIGREIKVTNMKTEHYNEELKVLKLKLLHKYVSDANRFREELRLAKRFELSVSTIQDDLDNIKL